MSGGDFVALITVGTETPAHAFGIQVRFQSSDLSILALATTVVNPTTTPPPATGTSIVTTSSLAPIPVSSGDLSQGAKIGIGVSIPLVLVISALVAFLLFRRRRKATRTDTWAASSNLPEVLHTQTSSASQYVFDPKPPTDQAPARGYYKHPHDNTVEVDSIPSRVANTYCTQPIENIANFSIPVVSPSFTTTVSPLFPSGAVPPPVFEADNSPYQRAHATELPAKQSKGESQPESTVTALPASYQFGNPAPQVEPEEKVVIAGPSLTEVNDEISYLESQQQKMQLKRERLKQMEKIEEEEARIQEKLAQLRKR